MNAPGQAGHLLLAASYVAVLALAFITARVVTAGPAGNRRYRTAWIAVIAIAAALLAVRLFDLDHRTAADLQRGLGPDGWQGRRAEAERTALAAALVGLPLAVATLLALRRWIDPRALLPGATVLALVGFLGIRALALPRVDTALQHRYLGIRLTSATELGLVATLIAVLALNVSREVGRGPRGAAAGDRSSRWRRASLARNHHGSITTRVGFAAVAITVAAAVPMLVLRGDDVREALPFHRTIGSVSRDGAIDLPTTTQLPPLPPHWPPTLQLGVADGLGTAASTASVAPFGFRYQYLAGGVNTGSGWATWNPNGAFVSNYVRESAGSGMTAVFTYYMIRQSAPGNTQSEADGVLNNLRNADTMRAYYADLRLFFQRAGAETSAAPILHVEPDLWGFLEQKTANNDASTVAVAVHASGDPELSDLPDTVAGFARAIVRLRDHYAPSVLLGYHMSPWGTGEDPLYSKPGTAHVDELAARAVAFLNSLQAHFDVAFVEFTDRDAGFKQAIYGDGGASWWDAADFTRHIRFVGDFVQKSGLRVVLWQIPFGNTQMRAVNNSWDHYQDNKVGVLLDDPGLGHLVDYANAGVIALLFGRGADGATCACDAAKDGVTNPPAINGNTRESINADDDGGFFSDRAAAYYEAGPLPIPGVPGGPAQLERTARNDATPRPLHPQSPTATWTSGASVSAASIGAGDSVTIRAQVTASSPATALVDIEVYDPANRKMFQKAFDGASFEAGIAQDFGAEWPTPSGLTHGTYRVKVGVFIPGWGKLLAWNDSAASFKVE